MQIKLIAVSGTTATILITFDDLSTETITLCDLPTTGGIGTNQPTDFISAVKVYLKAYLQGKQIAMIPIPDPAVLAIIGVTKTVTL